MGQDSSRGKGRNQFPKAFNKFISFNDVQHHQHCFLKNNARKRARITKEDLKDFQLLSSDEWSCIFQFLPIQKILQLQRINSHFQQLIHALSPTPLFLTFALRTFSAFFSRPGNSTASEEVNMLARQLLHGLKAQLLTMNEDAQLSPHFKRLFYLPTQQWDFGTTPSMRYLDYSAADLDGCTLTASKLLITFPNPESTSTKTPNEAYHRVTLLYQQLSEDTHEIAAYTESEETLKLLMLNPQNSCEINLVMEEANYNLQMNTKFFSQLQKCLGINEAAMSHKDFKQCLFGLLNRTSRIDTEDPMGLEEYTSSYLLLYPYYKTIDQLDQIMTKPLLDYLDLRSSKSRSASIAINAMQQVLNYSYCNCLYLTPISFMFGEICYSAKPANDDEELAAEDNPLDDPEIQQLLATPSTRRVIKRTLWQKAEKQSADVKEEAVELKQDDDNVVATTIVASNLVPLEEVTEAAAVPQDEIQQLTDTAKETNDEIPSMAQCFFDTFKKHIRNRRMEYTLFDNEDDITALNCKIVSSFELHMNKDTKLQFHFEFIDMTNYDLNSSLRCSLECYVCSNSANSSGSEIEETAIQVVTSQDDAFDNNMKRLRSVPGFSELFDSTIWTDYEILLFLLNAAMLDAPLHRTNQWLLNYDTKRQLNDRFEQIIDHFTEDESDTDNEDEDEDEAADEVRIDLNNIDSI